MLRSFCLLFTVILLASCQKLTENDKERSTLMRFHDDGRAKPVVAVVPMLDSTCYDLPWSLSDEFTSLIKSNLYKKDSLYIPKKNDVLLSSEDNPFGIDLKWIRNNFKPNEFVIFIEMVEHEDIPVKNKSKKIPESRKNATNLNISARLRIIDIRSDEPKIVLQEMIKDTFYMPNTFEIPDYNVIRWGSSNYKNTPLAAAHLRFAKTITEHVNDYIILAKSR